MAASERPRLYHWRGDRLRADGAFDLEPIAIQEVLQADPIHQCDLTAGGLVRGICLVRIRADPALALEAMVGQPWIWWMVGQPWIWWKDGEVTGWQRTAGGGARFVLQPLAPQSRWRIGLPARLGVELEPAEKNEESWQGSSHAKAVLHAHFSRFFSGPGRYEVVDVAGGCIVRASWNGVERKAASVRLLPMKWFLRLHMGAEKGDLRWPFPAGTGYPGLIRSLEEAAAAER